LHTGASKCDDDVDNNNN